MSFVETVERGRQLLERNGRLSLRALKREFALDDDTLAELAEELVEVQQVARRDGNVLVWVGEGAEPAAAIATPAASAAAVAPNAAPLAPDSGERRQLTVLFCDLVGSTELSTRLDPEELQDLVRAYQDAASGVIEKHGGHVAQYLGDGLLVYFGYPVAHDDDAERAVRAGLGIVQALEPVNAGLAVDRRLEVRVGIHTGPVVVGAMGGGARRETLALGETTNVAARLQGLAAPDAVVMSAATQRLVPGIFVVEELGARELKGVGEPVACFRVVQPSGMRSRLHVAKGRLTRFVGREAEMGALLDRWEQVDEGRGQNILLLGEAGVGKSRLAFELRERLAAEPHTWLETRATPYTQATPFHPVSELVEQGLAFGPEDSAEDRIAKLERGLAILGEPLAETLPVVARLLGLEVPKTYPLTELVPDLERQRTLEILSAWNLALSEAQPLVLLCEDLHWSDPSSLQLLGRVVEQSATARVLFIGTARPEFVPPWPARSNATTLPLARLTKRQAREMVVVLGAALPGATVDALVARADGVPLYLEELTKTVAEPGAARGEDAIPATLADSLMARLDRLSTAKEVAQRASVLGRELSYTLLAEVADLEEAALRQGLARLVEAEILFVRGAPPHATYTFKHALVQEAAYESLLKRTRQRLHGRVCEVFASDAGAEPEVLAHHAERAGRSEEAIRHLERAGAAARERSAHAEAVRHLERAIALLAAQPAATERDAREAELQYTLGLASAASVGYAHAATRAAYERALALAEACGDRRIWMWASGGIAVVESNRGQHERARALAESILAGAGTDEAERTCLGCQLITVYDFWLGRFGSSLRHAERTEPAYERLTRSSLRWLGDTDHRVVVSGFAAWSLSMLGRLDEALARAAEGVSHAERVGEPFSLAQALFLDAFARHLGRDFAGQRARSAETMAVGDRFGFPLWSGVARVFHGLARVTSGDASGLAEVQDGLARAGETGNQNGAPTMLGLLADAQRRVGKPSDARATLAGALALAAQFGERCQEADLHVTDGEIALAMGAPLDDVLARLRKAQAVARELGALRAELIAGMAMARALRDAGHSADAHAELAPVYAKFTQGFGTPLLVEAKALLGELGSGG